MDRLVAGHGGPHLFEVGILTGREPRERRLLLPEQLVAVHAAAGEEELADEDDPGVGDADVLPCDGCRAAGDEVPGAHAGVQHEASDRQDAALHAARSVSGLPHACGDR